MENLSMDWIMVVKWVTSLFWPGTFSMIMATSTTPAAGADNCRGDNNRVVRWFLVEFSNLGINKIKI